MPHDGLTSHRSNPDDAQQQQETAAADADPNSHGHDSAVGHESHSELPLLERQGGNVTSIRQWAAITSNSPAATIRLPITPHAASLSMPDTCNREDGKEETVLHVGAIKQHTAVMHAQITPHAVAGEWTSLPMPYQQPYVDRAARSQPGCSDTESSQHADVDSELDATERAPQTKAQQAQFYTHSSSVGSAVVAFSPHEQSSDEPHKDELHAAAAITTQSSSGPEATVTTQSSSSTATSRSRPTGSVALDPLHPAKAIWLGFVRRAYRKFGKDMLSTIDLRWRTKGASALATAWRRSDPARKLAHANHAMADSTNAAAAAGDVGLDKASTADARAGCTPSTCLSSSCVFDAAAATVLDIDAHHEVPPSVRRVTRSCIRASADVQLRQALTNMLQVGGSAQKWVLTWPSGMVEFDIDQLLLMQRHSALHRSRNARPKPIARVATLQSESESS